MGLFSAPKPPNTISDKEYGKLRERARKAERHGSLTPQAARQRRASESQRRRAGAS